MYLLYIPEVTSVVLLHLPKHPGWKHVAFDKLHFPQSPDCSFLVSVCLVGTICISTVFTRSIWGDSLWTTPEPGPGPRPGPGPGPGTGSRLWSWSRMEPGPGKGGGTFNSRKIWAPQQACSPEEPPAGPADEPQKTGLQLLWGPDGSDRQRQRPGVQQWKR